MCQDIRTLCQWILRHLTPRVDTRTTVIHYIIHSNFLLLDIAGHLVFSNFPVACFWSPFFLLLLCTSHRWQRHWKTFCYYVLGVLVDVCINRPARNEILQLTSGIQIFPSRTLVKNNIVGSLLGWEVVWMGWDHQGSNFKSCVRRAVSSVLPACPIACLSIRLFVR